jgi:putative transcriptional regulator
MAKFEVINNIRKLRFEHNEMTQQELAKITGVTRQTIAAIENGKYSPSLELAFLIAHAFGTSIEEVFTCQIKD